MAAEYFLHLVMSFKDVFWTNAFLRGWQRDRNSYSEFDGLAFQQAVKHVMSVISTIKITIKLEWHILNFFRGVTTGYCED